MADEQAELAQPGKGALDLPSAAIAPQLSGHLRAAGGRGPRRAWSPQALLHAERQKPAVLPEEDLGRRPVPSTSFPCRAWLCRLPHPFFTGAKLPSRKVSCQSSRPCSSSTLSRVRQASSHTPCSSHCCYRRQQVAGEGSYLHVDTLHRVHNRRMFSNRYAVQTAQTEPDRTLTKQARFEAQGRPRLSFRRFGFGSSGSISSHCSSVNSFRRAFMTEAHNVDYLTRKSHS